MRLCRRCHEDVVTEEHHIFELCQPCFKWFEAKSAEATVYGEKYTPTNEELEWINEPFIRRVN